jgi:hypothetical protein
MSRITADELWRWFAANQLRLRQVSDDPGDPLHDALLGELHRFDDGIFFQIGGAPAGPTELILTADGELDVMPRVRALVDCAPAFEGWEIIALIPAQGFDFVTEHGPARIDVKRAWFAPRPAPGAATVGVRIACAEYDPRHDDDFVFAARVALLTALGERVAAEQVDPIEVGPLPADPAAEGYLQLPELPGYLERHGAQRGD